MEHGANPETPNAQGDTPLMIAAEEMRIAEQFPMTRC